MLQFPNDFIPLGKDGKSDKILTVIPAGLYEGLPDSGIGILLSSCATPGERFFGDPVSDEEAEKAIPICGIWFYDERAIDAHIKMLNFAKDVFKKNKGDDERGKYY